MTAFLCLTLALTALPSSARLLDDEPMQMAPSLEGMSRSALKERLEVLDETMPSLGGPITLTMMGAGGTLLGLLTTFQGVLFSSGFMAIGATLFIAVGIALMVAGVGMVIGGAIWWSARVQARRPYQEEIERIDAMLEGKAVPEFDSPAAPRPIDNAPPLPVSVRPSHVPMTALASF